MAQLGNVNIVCVGAPTVGELPDECTIPAIQYILGGFSMAPFGAPSLSSNAYHQSDDFTIECTSAENSHPCFGISYFDAIRLWAGEGWETCFDCLDFSLNLIIPLASVVGTPRVGIVIQVVDDSEAVDTQCFGLVVDFTDDTVKLILWNHESLETYGTILASRPMSEWIEGGNVVIKRLRILPNNSISCANIVTLFSGDVPPQLLAFGLVGWSYQGVIDPGDPPFDHTNYIYSDPPPSMTLVTPTNTGVGFVVVGVEGSGNAIDSAQMIVTACTVSNFGV